MKPDTSAQTPKVQHYAKEPTDLLVTANVVTLLLAVLVRFILRLFRR